MSVPSPEDVIACAPLPGMNKEPMYLGSVGARLLIQCLENAGYVIVAKEETEAAAPAGGETSPSSLVMEALGRR
jgi:hypothetical protein